MPEAGQNPVYNGIVFVGNAWPELARPSASIGRGLGRTTPAPQEIRLFIVSAMLFMRPRLHRSASASFAGNVRR